MYAIKCGKIYTITQGIIEDGIILVENGKIVDVGRNLTIPEGAEILDASTRVVMPGIVEAQSRIGIIEEGVSFAGNDINEDTDPITPHVRAIDGIKVNADEGGLKAAVEAGVTTVQILPGDSNVVAGSAVILKTSPKVTPEEMVVKNPSGIKMNFMDSPLNKYGSIKRAPSSRMGMVYVLRNFLTQTLNYIDKKKKAGGHQERNLKYEAMIPVLEGELPILAHAHRADDISAFIRVCEEFNLKMVLHYATEGHRVAEILAEKDIPVVHGTVFNIQPRSWEKRELSYKTGKILHDAGVKLAITSNAMSQVIRLVPLVASLYVKNGLPREEALKAITLNPAEIMGISDKVGSIEQGKDAD